MKPTKEQLEAYKEMAKTSPDSVKAMIEANLKATCDKYAGHEDRLDDCIDYLTDCAAEILGHKSGEVDNETCFRICRDYFNDEIWAKEDQEKAAKAEKRKDDRKRLEEERAARKKAAEEKKKAEALAKKAAAEARKAEIARKKAEALAKKKAEEEAKKAELERMKADAARKAEAMKADSIKPEPGQLDFFALMGV